MAVNQYIRDNIGRYGRLSILCRIRKIYMIATSGDILIYQIFFEHKIFVETVMILKTNYFKNKLENKLYHILTKCIPSFYTIYLN